MACKCGQNSSLTVLNSVLNIVLIKIASNRALMISPGLLSFGQEVMEAHWLVPSDWPKRSAYDLNRWGESPFFHETKTCSERIAFRLQVFRSAENNISSR